MKFLLFPTKSCFVSFRGGPDIRKNRSGGCRDKCTEYAAVAHLVERHLAKVEVASSSLVGRSIGVVFITPYMVTWPSGKARVCKTLIHQFKSGRHLQKIPGSFGFRDFFVLHCLLPASSPSQSPAATDSPFCRYATSSPGRGKSFLKGRASGETGHFAVKPKSLPQHPLP